ncbi:MAG: CvpA family protein [Ignavibacteria bacterium]|nr:CvpA family protein [Ignavibacteria bacterium]
MNYIDYIIIAFVIIAFLLGYKDGLVRKLIGIIGFFVAIYASFKFSKDAAGIISPIFNNDMYLSEIVSGILIFLLVILIVAIIKRIVHPIDKVNRFINQILGGISGSVQAVFFLSALFLVLRIFNYPNDVEKNNSMLFNDIYTIVPTVIDYIIGNDSEKIDLFEDIIKKNDTDSLNIENYINNK